MRETAGIFACCWYDPKSHAALLFIATSHSSASWAAGHDQKHQLAQTAQVSALPLRSEPISLPACDAAAAPSWSRASQAEPSLASRRLQPEQSTALRSSRDGPFSTGQVPAHAGTSSTLQQSESKPPWIRSDAPFSRAPAQRTASGDHQNAGRTLHTSPSPAVACQGSPGGHTCPGLVLFMQASFLRHL